MTSPLSFVLEREFWLALAVVIFVPSIIVRLAVRIYPRGHERRDEVVAELHAVPPLRRPLWAIEQLELILFEGIPIRWDRELARRWYPTVRLTSGRRLNRLHPTTFLVPDARERAALQEGHLAKLVFRQRTGWSERLWVMVEDRTWWGSYTAVVVSCSERLPVEPMSAVRFRARHVVGVDDNTTPRYAAPPGEVAVCSRCSVRNDPYI